METMKLLPQEVAIYEGVKVGKTIPQIAKELDGYEKKGSTFARVKRMADIGILLREGMPKSYKYTVAEKPYEIVDSRKMDDIPAVDDKVLNDLVGFTLSEDKVQKLRDNYKTLSRSELVKMLGITKLELNHVMVKLGFKKKEVKDIG
jgi:hypothetical protein